MKSRRQMLYSRIGWKGRPYVIKWRHMGQARPVEPHHGDIPIAHASEGMLDICSLYVLVIL